jgi:hypothetical protein
MIVIIKFLTKFSETSIEIDVTNNYLQILVGANCGSEEAWLEVTKLSNEKAADADNAFISIVILIM